MSSSVSAVKVDPKLDLVLERVIDVPRELVWAAWTTPEHLKKWFTPAPWKTVEVEIDLRPGGIFRFVMESPEGQKFPNIGCCLEVVPQERLAWTNVLGPGYRPTKPVDGGCGELCMTALVTFEKHGSGTKYRAVAVHADEESRAKHEKMGFYEGWGAALNQLIDLVKKM